MKQFKHKKLLAFGGLGLAMVLLTSCTANFCSPVDQAAMAYPADQGVTVYLSKAEYQDLKTNGSEVTKALIAQQETWSAEAQALGLGLPNIAGPAFVDDEGNVLNDNVYKYIPFGVSDSTSIIYSAYKTKAFFENFVTTANKAGYTMPGAYYYAMIDDYVLRAATTSYLMGSAYEYTAPSEFQDKIVANADNKAKLATVISGTEVTAEMINSDTATYIAVNPYVEADPTATPTEIPVAHSILRQNGKVKFSGYKLNADNKIDHPFLGHYNTWNNAIRERAGQLVGDKSLSFFNIYDVPGADFVAYYGNQILSKVNTVRSCIATRSDYFGHYGTFADWRVAIEQKDWGYAWSKGFFEGLLVYPITWMVDTLSYSFNPTLTGVGQIWALVIVTLIVRGLLLAFSWRTTADNQKMQALQPELAKLQQKYPNANNNPAEKQRMSQEQMMLYKRHGIKPFRQIIIMIIQFPVFICVWSGLQGSAALSTGELLNMRLSDNINSILFNTSGAWYYNDHGWWTALVLFILMASTQIMAMVLPRLFARRAQKDVAKLGKSQTAAKQNNTMKWVSYGMIIFTIIMGFFLPSAMGVYWLIGGLISIIQTVITQLVLAKKKGKK